MRTLVSKKRSVIQGHDQSLENQLIIPDLVTLLAHPEFTGESFTTLQRMAPNIEAYLRHNLVCQPCFERELEVLRKLRPEMEAGVKAADHLGFSDKQAEAHISAYCAKISTALRRAVEEALKIWIFEVLNVHVQIWDSDISSEGFYYETLKITKIAVPSQGLHFLQRLTANNDKLPRRSAAPRVHIKGTDPYLSVPFDIGVMCGVRDAIVVAIHQWD